jgi:hypothetical protein
MATKKRSKRTIKPARKKAARATGGKRRPASKAKPAKAKAKLALKAKAKTKPKAKAKAKAAAASKRKTGAVKRAAAKRRAPAAKAVARRTPSLATPVASLAEARQAARPLVVGEEDVIAEHDIVIEVPEPQPAVALYDLVCPVDGRIAGGLEFAACATLARAHNEANEDHGADCFQQQPPPDLQ